MEQEAMYLHNEMKDDIEHAERKARNGWGMGLAGVLTGGAALLSQWAGKGGCGGGFGNLFGGNNCGCNNGCGMTINPYMQTEIDWLSQKECDDALELTRAIYGMRIQSMNERFADRQTINGEMFGLYKSQTDADFGLYKNQRDGFDVLANRISELEKREAVQAAVTPYQHKILQNEICCVAKQAKDDVMLEAYKRCCADQSIILYSNSTFAAKETVNFTTGTETTPMPLYDPIPCCNPCGCCNKGNSPQFAL